MTGLEYNKCEFAEERNLELYGRFRTLLRLAPGLSLRKLFAMAARQQASRFWVSERRATDVVSEMLRGKARLEGMYPERRRMFEEICRRVRELREERGPEVPLYHLVFDVVNSPAPEFYITAGTARELIYKVKREMDARKGKGVRHDD